MRTFGVFEGITEVFIYDLRLVVFIAFDLSRLLMIIDHDFAFGSQVK